MEEQPPTSGLPPPPEEPGVRRSAPVRARPLRTYPARRRAGAVVVLGGAMVVIGVFLPWVAATGPSGTATESAYAMGSWAFLILGGFAILRGLSMSRPDPFRTGLGSPLIGGVLLAVLMVIRWNELQALLRDGAPDPRIVVSLGVGVWVTIAGTLLILVGGLLAIRRRP